MDWRGPRIPSGSRKRGDIRMQGRDIRINSNHVLYHEIQTQTKGFNFKKQIEKKERSVKLFQETWGGRILLEAC